ncbi:MAG: hypothetical protein EWM73_03055 [Nitrospira sp.]|nr:MAG: hypothetical protein EWM73_03055 [Nitrospira sp.]
MASPVKLYHQEMHNNLGYFATWLPASIIELGDIGVLDAGRFRRVGSLKELGIQHSGTREGTAENMSYSASAKRGDGASVGASTIVPVAKAEISIQFTSQGGFVFDAVGMRNIEIADRLAVATDILKAYERGQWQKEWLVVEAMYHAVSATIIVSEDSASEIVLKANANVPLGTLPLADPKLGLSVSSSNGKLVHLVAADNLHPLYSCLKVRDPLFGAPSVAPVRGLGKDESVRKLSRPAIEDLLES